MEQHLSHLTTSAAKTEDHILSQLKECKTQISRIRKIVLKSIDLEIKESQLSHFLVV